ncbi:MAG TPA: type II secretion system protein [Planctomycetota bacterium]
MKRARRGFTLIEVLIASVILAILLGAIFILVFQGGSTYADASRHVTLQRNAREVLERIAQELRYAQPVPTHVASPGYLQFKKSIGFDGANTIWSKDITIQTNPSQADANNNGIADDLQLIRTATDHLVGGVPTGAPVTSILCEYVKSFTVTYSDWEKTKDVDTRVHKYELSITLAVMDEDQKEMSTTVTTTVVLRKQQDP